MRARDSRGLGWSVVLAAVLLVGCAGGKGVRKLENVEKQYFETLDKELQASTRPINEVMALTARNEEQAIREIAAFEARVANARRIYSLREVLTAPKSDSAEFIQVTRNKVILYHLAEAVDAENERVAATVAIADSQRKQLTQLYGEIATQSQTVLQTEQALHQYMNQELPQQFADSLMEVAKQLGAFNEEIQQADQNNALIPVLMQVGKHAEHRVEQVDQGLDKFIEFWPRLNTANTAKEK
jgi:CheY-like chemotaxis protein